MYDLVVIGGGPAGCAAAISAARAGADVLLLEAGEYPRHKVCGEFISPDAHQLLNSLIGEFLPVARFRPLPGVRLFIDGRVLTSVLDPPALSISRFELDAALWAAAACAGVEARLQTRVERLEGTGPFWIYVSGERLSARSVINASGRWSRFNARPQFPSRAAVGIKAHFFETSPSQTVDLYFFQGGYCGVSSVSSSAEPDAKAVNVSALVARSKRASLSDIFARNRDLWLRSQQWQPISGTEASTYPVFFRKPSALDGKILLAGDAAGFIDPFAGDGIALALRTGVMASRSLVPFWRAKSALGGAAEQYRRDYNVQILPCFRAAARIRRLLSLPRVLRWPLTRLIEASHLTPHFLQATRPGADRIESETNAKIAA